MFPLLITPVTICLTSIRGYCLRNRFRIQPIQYKQGNNFHPAIKTDAQRPITFKEDTSTYTLRNRVKPAQKYDVFALRHILI